MKIYNICDSLTISVVKHVQLQKMAGCETVTSYRKSGILKFAAERCGVVFNPANVESLRSFVAWADIVVIHTSLNSTNLLSLDTIGKPIIWACHDFVAGATVPVDKIACALVPSIGYKVAMENACDIPAHVVHRKVAKADWPKWSENRIDCTIMPGAVSNHKAEPWRDYSTARDMLDGRFIVMSSRFPSNMSESFMVMELTDPAVMLQNMAKFETSWCGCGNDRITFDTIVNNKFFESIAAGCVPILYRSKEMSEYAHGNCCGITWPDEFPEGVEIDYVRENIAGNKEALCLESELPAFMKILEMTKEN